MLVQEKNCKICSGSEFIPHLKCKDHSISGEEFQIVKCKQCGFLFTSPYPSELEIGPYYQSEKYISHSDTKRGFINSIYHKVRNITLSQKLKLISRYFQKGSILDIGCGTGYFLKYCKDHQWQIAGTEPDESARKMASENSGTNIEKSVFDVKGKYDVITLWHVLEHVHRLNETIQQIKNVSHQQSKVIIALPNHESKDAQTYGSFWAAYDVPRHLYHFDKKSITQLMQNHDFKLIDIKPMKFDSFYVSMLSQQYKTGKSNLLVSFINGLLSNIYSKNNQNNSSLIYIFENVK